MKKNIGVSLPLDSSVVRMSGGLGNQLSQLAFSISLSNETKTQSYLDIDSYSYAPRGSDRLPLLSLMHPFSDRIICSTSLKDRMLLVIAPNSLRARFSLQHERELMSSNDYLSKVIIKENGFPYDSNLQFREGSYYVGNFISTGYWKKYSFEIIGMFNSIISSIVESKSTKMNFTDQRTLGIHARRGDYLSNSKARKFHGYCGDRYFLQAVTKAIENESSFDQIWISSDERNYAEHLKDIFKKFKIPVMIDSESNPILALYKLSYSNSLIGSNSTFSWWAGNLGVDKELYFPEKWFADTRYNLESQDLYLKTPHLINIPLET